MGLEYLSVKLCIKFDGDPLVSNICYSVASYSLRSPDMENSHNLEERRDHSPVLMSACHVFLMAVPVFCGCLV